MSLKYLATHYCFCRLFLFGISVDLIKIDVICEKMKINKEKRNELNVQILDQLLKLPSYCLLEILLNRLDTRMNHVSKEIAEINA